MLDIVVVVMVVIVVAVVVVFLPVAVIEIVVGFVFWICRFVGSSPFIYVWICLRMHLCSMCVCMHSLSATFFVSLA